MGTVPKLEDCNVGWEPTEFNVIVAIEETETKTAGGIIIPDAAKEKTDAAAQRGLLVSISPLAFSYGDWPAGTRKPEPGDMIIFKRYAGVFTDDKMKFRIMKDTEIMAIANG